MPGDAHDEEAKSPMRHSEKLAWLQRKSSDLSSGLRGILQKNRGRRRVAQVSGRVAPTWSNRARRVNSSKRCKGHQKYS